MHKKENFGCKWSSVQSYLKRVQVSVNSKFWLFMWDKMSVVLGFYKEQASKESNSILTRSYRAIWIPIIEKSSLKMFNLPFVNQNDMMYFSGLLFYVFHFPNLLFDWLENEKYSFSPWGNIRTENHLPEVVSSKRNAMEIDIWYPFILSLNVIMSSASAHCWQLPYIKE